jgi:peptide-methionine (S)-S-oxide reductase
MNNHDIATLAGGCFWCLEASFQELRGIERVVSGYTGGNAPDPTYQQVCRGGTGHAEAVQLSFDPAIIPYRDILGIFFTLHDPTTLNRQGHDIGSQYRSAIFCHSPEQLATAREVIAGLERDRVWPDPIVTRLEPAGVFYPAEDYHQDYFRNNPMQPYCLAVVAPKVAKLRKLFKDRLRK